MKPKSGQKPQGGHAVCNDIIFSEAVRDEIHLSIDELARRGAQRMLALALHAEVDEYVGHHAGERADNGHALVVRKDDDGHPLGIRHGAAPGVCALCASTPAILHGRVARTGGKPLGRPICLAFTAGRPERIGNDLHRIRSQTRLNAGHILCMFMARYSPQASKVIARVLPGSSQSKSQRKA